MRYFSDAAIAKAFAIAVPHHLLTKFQQEVSARMAVTANEERKRRGPISDGIHPDRLVRGIDPHVQARICLALQDWKRVHEICDEIGYSKDHSRTLCEEMVRTGDLERKQDSTGYRVHYRAVMK